METCPTLRRGAGKVGRLSIAAVCGNREYGRYGNLPYSAKGRGESDLWGYLMKKILSGLIALIVVVITSCGNGAIPSNLKVPAPPKYKLYELGQDAMLDQLVTLMDVEGELRRAAMQQGATVKVLDKGVYTSEAPAKEIITFYEQEMAQRGWREDNAGSQNAEGMYIRTFAAGDGEYGAAVIIMDPGVLYEEVGTIYVWTFSAQQSR